jgi:predicted negative regulator of RcsB-dependent stress response
MNNQRRHELERNVLADKLGAGIEKANPIIKPLLVACLVGIVGFFGYQLWSTQASKKASEEWSSYYFNQATDAQSYQALGESFSSSTAGQWAKHTAARAFLSQGITALYVNRKEAEENIRKAITQWESVKNSSIEDLKAASALGLATAHESLGELDKAVDYLESYTKIPGVTEDQRKTALDQVSYLKSNGAKSFYDWFNKLDPKPAAPPTISPDLSKPPTEPSLTLDPNSLPNLGNEAGAVPAVPSNPPADNPAPFNPPADGAGSTAPSIQPTTPAAPVIEPAAPVSTPNPSETPAPSAEPTPNEPAPVEPAPQPTTEPAPPATEPAVVPESPGPAPADIPK